MISLDNVFEIDGSDIGCNVYIHPPFVIDAGINGELIADKIRDYDLEEEIEYLFLTHSHFDHIAGTSYIKDKFQLKVIAHEKTKIAVENEDSSLILFNMFNKDFVGFDVDICIAEEEEISGFEIIPTPGHCENSLTLIDKDQKVGFVGDLFFPNGGLGRTDLPTGDSHELLNSMRKLDERSIDLFYTGHGGVSKRKGFKLSLNKARDLYERNL